MKKLNFLTEKLILAVSYRPNKYKVYFITVFTRVTRTSSLLDSLRKNSCKLE